MESSKLLDINCCSLNYLRIKYRINLCSKKNSKYRFCLSLFSGTLVSFEEINCCSIKMKPVLYTNNFTNIISFGFKGSRLKKRLLVI